MEENKYNNLFFKIDFIQEKLEELSHLPKISVYEKILGEVDICIEQSSNCSECQEYLDHFNEAVDKVYKSVPSSWKITDTEEIFNRSLPIGRHLCRKHNYYDRGKDVFNFTVFFVLIDIVMFILFLSKIMAFPTLFSFPIYFLSKYIEDLWIKKFNIKYI